MYRPSPPPAPQVPAGALAPWDVGELPEAPKIGWRTGLVLVGPGGGVLAGTSIGPGEWLFGPAVTAQYGASLLWLALPPWCEHGIENTGDETIEILICTSPPHP